VSTRTLRSERCWERVERFGSLERIASDSVSSSSRALMAEDEFNSSDLGLGCACNWCEACFRASRTLRTRGLSSFDDGSSMADRISETQREREREMVFLESFSRK